MGYYFRYIVVDDRAVSLSEAGASLAASDPRFAFNGDATAGTLLHGGRPIAQLEVNVPGDGLFDEERGELIEFAKDSAGPGKHQVLQTLRTAQAIVAAQVLFGDGDTELTLALLDPLWEWLSASRAGLLQADGEGYYAGAELVLELG